MDISEQQSVECRIHTTRRPPKRFLVVEIDKSCSTVSVWTAGTWSWPLMTCPLGYLAA